jgi:hypothetical protein
LDLEAVWSRLAGIWAGRGTGSYPHIGTFGYLEELVIAREPGWPMLSVLQRTWHDESGVRGNGIHLESGIIRAREDGSLVYGCGQDSGRTEVMTGVVSPEQGLLRIDWVTIAHSNDERLLKMGRTWWIDDSTLRYEAHLSTVRYPEYRKHLEATLRQG